MDDNKIIDFILKFLYDNQQKTAGIYIKDAIIKPNNILLNANQYARIRKKIIADNLAEEKQSLIGGDDCLVISRFGIKIIESYNSFSSFQQFQQQEQSRKTKAQNAPIKLNRITTIFMIVFGLSTCILGWSNFIKEDKLDELNIENDSLNKLIAKQNVFIDSLRDQNNKSDSTIHNSSKQ